MKAIVVASQAINDTPFVREHIGQPDLVVAADGGSESAEAIGLMPDVLVGDFDSISREKLCRIEKSGIPVVRHPREKDETDGELAILYATRKGADELVILGAMGGRIDHEIANLLLLARPELRGRRAVMVDGWQSVRLLCSGETLTIMGKRGDILSLLPFSGDARGISTKGLLYPLHEDTLLMGPARGVSNEFIASEATISLAEGSMWVVHISSDRGGAYHEQVR